MPLVIKNKRLYKKIMRLVNTYSDKAIKYYGKGLMKKGRIWEKKSDRVYAKYYKQIFEIRR